MPCNRPDVYLHNRLASLEQEFETGDKNTVISDTLVSTCPKCGKKAEGQKEVEEKFGFRNIGKKTIPQSWCRDCR